MANEEHLAILKQGWEVWNEWREENPDIRPDLSQADLSQADLREANLYGADLSFANLNWANLSFANLRGANFSWTELFEADLRGADLRKANLYGADLYYEADLRKADLREADLREANLYRADLTMANLSGSFLEQAHLVETNLQGANLTGCHVYGISAWDLQLEGATQSNLVITHHDEPIVTVDDLEVAQFVYLILNREKIRNVLTTITSKAVLILGRFTPERKTILDAIADELRKHDLLPIIFDFERATSRDFTETIKTLAGLSLFVIVDITSPKSSPLELQATVPDYQIPFVPIIQQGEQPFSMFSDLQKYDWVLTPVLEYASKETLLQGFKEAIVERAWNKHQELQAKKAERVEMRSIEDFLKGSGI